MTSNYLQVSAPLTHRVQRQGQLWCDQLMRHCDVCYTEWMSFVLTISLFIKSDLVIFLFTSVIHSSGFVPYSNLAALLTLPNCCRASPVIAIAVLLNENLMQRTKKGVFTLGLILGYDPPLPILCCHIHLLTEWVPKDRRIY